MTVLKVLIYSVIFPDEVQSVLVTIDRHEWYAPPQIYSRDDSSGLWLAKPAIQPESLLVSSGVGGTTESLMSQMDPVCGNHHLGRVHQGNNQEYTDGVSMETSCEHGSEELNSRDESDGGRKKLRVGEYVSADDAVAADCSLNGNENVKLGSPSTMENAGSRDYQGAIAATANASLAESVIEPTLVMFEVNLKSYMVT